MKEILAAKVILKLLISSIDGCSVDGDLNRAGTPDLIERDLARSLVEPTTDDGNSEMWNSPGCSRMSRLDRIGRQLGAAVQGCQTSAGQHQYAKRATKHGNPQKNDDNLSNKHCIQEQRSMLAKPTQQSGPLLAA